MGWRVGNTALILAWLAWAGPSLRWLVRGWLTDPDGVAQLAVAAVALVTVARSPFRARPESRLGPMGLLVGGPALALVTADLDSLRAACMVASGFGLVGLFLAGDPWRRLGAAPLLGLVVLPVSPVVDAILGWPLRKALAGAAAAALGGMPVETVIEVQGSVTHVDAPCAGVRSLWALAALILLWALRSRVPVGPRLVLALGVSAFAGVAANLGRVVVIVGLAELLGWPLVADSVHVPLGVVGFALTLGSAALVLTSPLPFRFPLPLPLPIPVPIPSPIGLAPPQSRLSSTVQVGIAVLWLLLSAVASPSVSTPVPPDPPVLPAGFTPVDPSAPELTFAAQRGGALAKGRSSDGAVVALVASRSWLAHHVPDQCLRAAGWVPGEERLVVVGGVTARRVELTRGGQHATAIWWFQSGDRVTDDLVVRIRDGWATGRPWVLVSVLVPDGVDPEPVVRALRGVSS